MEWHWTSIDVLFEAYCKETCLYNTKSPMYNNKHARKEALDRICDSIKEFRPSTHSDIITKMKSLRATFVNELNKIKNSTKSGAGSNEVYKPIVWHFDKLNFLRDPVQGRKSTCSTMDFASTEVHFMDTSSIIDGDNVVVTLEETNEPLFLDIPSTSGVATRALDSQTSDVATGTGDIQYTIDIPDPLLASTPKPTKRMRKDPTEEKNAILNNATNILNNISKRQSQVTDDIDALSVFVSASLKQFKSKALILRAKREILNVVMMLQEEEFEMNQ